MYATSHSPAAEAHNFLFPFETDPEKCKSEQKGSEKYDQ